MVFKKIGLAITFSPTGRALLKEVKRLSDLFQAEVVLIHIGEKNNENESRLHSLIESAGFNKITTKVEWETGDIVQTILTKVKENSIDLLIAGALEKENFITYYIGSVARRLMREAPCSTLILTAPSEQPRSYQKFCVSVEYSGEGEATLKLAHKLATLEQAREFIMIREFQVPGLSMTIHETGSIRDIENTRKKWEREEKEKMEILIRELNLTGIALRTVCLYGKEGYEANKYVENINADIYCLPSPKKKLNFLDRLFQHDLEFTLKQIPCPVLIVRNNK